MASAEGWVCVGWIIAGIFAGVAAVRMGVAQPAAFASVALAIVPAAATLALNRFPGWRSLWTSYAWLAFATAAAAASGGFHSPMAAAFLLAPAFARTAREAAEAAFFASLAFAIAGIVALTGPAAPAMGPMPSIGAAASLIAAGALMAGLSRPAPMAQARPALQISAESEELAREAAESLALQRRRVAELSHELRTPLTHIIGFADVMRQRLFGPLHEKYGEYVELIHTSGQNLLDLSNRLLDLSRIEAGRFTLQREEFDIALIVEEVVRLSEEAASAKGVALTMEPVRLPLQVNADVAAMRQILINLVANAIKFTPAGGKVRVRAYAHDGKLRLEVEDDGPGIPADERARLGRPYERGASGAAAEGYGLGLSLVRAFAQLHEGTLSFHDAPGGGALVRVEAPVFA